MSRLGLLALFVCAPALGQEVTRKDLKPGLVAEFTNAPSRIDPAPALTLGPGELPHPSAKDAAVSWAGYLRVETAGLYTFTAAAQGWAADVTLADGQQVARVGDASEVRLAAKAYRFRAKLTPVAAAQGRRFELLWQGPGFRREPVPHYLFGHLPKDRPARLAADRADDHGRFLFEEHACKKCHAPDAKSLADRSGPNLADVGKRAFAGWLDAWLADPQKLRPHTTMPKAFADTDHGRAERYAVVAYLASLGGPLAESRTPTVSNQYGQSVTNGRKLYLTTGCAACHGDQLTQPPTAKKKDDPDEDDKPLANPEDQFYSVGASGPQGLYTLGSPGSKTTPEAMAKYLTNPLATNPHGRMPNMNLGGQEAQDLARYLCRQTDAAVPREMPAAPKLAAAAVAPSATIVNRWRLAKLKPADQWKAVGRQLLTAKGCVNCHAVEPASKPLPAVAVREVRDGCLAAKPDPAKVPVYNLDATQKAALATFLAGGRKDEAPSPAFAARAALKRFNCLNCHQRDGEGGLPSELAEQMRLLEKAENADDVSPPRLTGAGHKLRTSWLKAILTQGGRARPWMTLRMPQYGDANVGFLADALPKLEGTTADDAVGKAEFTAAKVEAGRLLTGKAGHGCVACHDMSGVSTGGTRGPDLALTNQRVRYDWYVRWMHQPQRLAPGTRMPQNFTDGKTQLASAFNGDGDKQIEAMWAYFALGPGLPLPAGMEPPKGLIVAVKDRPEILRTFMPDNAGTKPIAVGYPGGTNLVFDAATCRVAYAWSGNFLDASPVWNNRGGNPAKLLGPKFLTAPGYFPWAVTDSHSTPDFRKRADDPAYGHQLPDDRYYDGPRLVHFNGYTLDATGRPTFRYALTDAAGKVQMSVTDTPEPLPVTVAAGLKRTFTVERPAGKEVWLLVGEASNGPPRVSQTPKQVTRAVLPGVGGRATVVDVVAGPTGWEVWEGRTSGGVVLLIPGTATGGKVTLVLNVWGVPRDDAELLKGLK